MRNIRALVAVALFLSTLFLAGVLYQTGDVPTDETVTSVEIDENGDAVFELELRTRLDTQERREAFETFESEVEQNPENYLSSFRASVIPIVEEARNQTEREMSASNFTIETAIEPLPVERGVVRYTFEWSGFAEVDGGGADATQEIRAGDVLSAYILSEGDSLVFLYPKDYSVDSVNPEPDTHDSGETRWDGPRDFSEEQPRLTLVESTDGTVDSVDTGGEDGTEETPESSSLPLYVYGVVLVALLSAGAVVYHRRRPVESEQERGEETPDEAEEEVFENIPDDERILSIVEGEGGRMKQKHVVEETGWSEAKVSQVTSRLEDEDKIRKLRMGRENILEIQDKEEDEEDEPPGL